MGMQSDRGITEPVPAHRHIASMSESERFAVRLMRRTLKRAPDRNPQDPEPSIDAAALARVGSVIDAALDRLALARSVPLDLADLDASDLTRDERGLLRALAAAQQAEEAVLDNYLIRLAPGRVARSHLAVALHALADVLDASGRILARPGLLCWTLPAAALTVARLHGHLPALSLVAWPPCA